MLSLMSAKARCPPILAGLAEEARGYQRLASSLTLETSIMR